VDQAKQHVGQLMQQQEDGGGMGMGMGMGMGEHDFYSSEEARAEMAAAAHA
jgi:hypothetical protein